MRFVHVFMLWFVLFTSISFAWETSFSSGIKQWNNSGKGMVVFLTATWCGFCRDMERDVFTDPEVIRLLSQVVKVRLYHNSEEYQKVDQQYFTSDEGLPAFLFFRPGSGHLPRPEKATGFLPVNDFKKKLNGVLGKAEQQVVPSPSVLPAVPSRRPAPVSQQEVEGGLESSPEELLFQAESEYLTRKEALPLPVLFYVVDTSVSSPRWVNELMKSGAFLSAAHRFTERYQLDIHSKAARKLIKEASATQNLSRNPKPPLIFLKTNQGVLDLELGKESDLATFLSLGKASAEGTGKQQNSSRRPKNSVESTQIPQIPQGETQGNQSQASSIKTQSPSGVGYQRHLAISLVSTLGSPARSATKKEMSSYLEKVVAKAVANEHSGTAFLVSFSADDRFAFAITNYHVAFPEGSTSDGARYEDALPLTLKFINGDNCDSSAIYSVKRSDLALLMIQDTSCFTDVKSVPIIPTAPLVDEHTSVIYSLGFSPDRKKPFQVGTHLEKTTRQRDGEDASYLSVTSNLKAEDGDSGSPVVNSFGQLIGVLNVGRSGASGFISIEEVHKMNQEIRKLIPRPRLK